MEDYSAAELTNVAKRIESVSSRCLSVVIVLVMVMTAFAMIVPSASAATYTVTVSISAITAIDKVDSGSNQADFYWRVTLGGVAKTSPQVYNDDDTYTTPWSGQWSASGGSGQSYSLIIEVWDNDYSTPTMDFTYSYSANDNDLCDISKRVGGDEANNEDNPSTSRAEMIYYIDSNSWTGDDNSAGDSSGMGVVRGDEAPDSSTGTGEDDCSVSFSVSRTSYNGVPTLKSPGNLVTGVSTSPTLEWYAPAVGANYYQIATDMGSGNVYYYSSTTSKTVTLSASTTYWWSVRASPDSGATYGPWSSTWQFTTGISYTGVPTLKSPINNAGGVSTSPTLEWYAPAVGANYYQIATDKGSGNVYYYSSTTTKTVTLSASTTYWWSVRASPDSGATYGPWSSTWQFTTGASAPPVTYVVAVTISAITAIDKVDTGSNQADFYWRVTLGGVAMIAPQVYNDDSTYTTPWTEYWTLTGGNGESYPLIIEVWDNDYSTPRMDFTYSYSANDNDLCDISKRVGGDELNNEDNPSTSRAEMTYYIDTKSWTGDDNSAGDTSGKGVVRGDEAPDSSTGTAEDDCSVTFDVQRYDPYSGVPTLTSPANDLTGVSSPTTLQWTAPSGANYYEIAVILGSGGPTLYHSTITSITLSMQPLSTYHWQVRASNNGGVTYGSWSSLWSFTTKDAWNGVATLMYPGNGRTGVPVGFTFTWNAPTGANFYELYCSWPGSEFTQLTTVPYLVCSLIPGTTYSWRVLSSNDGGATFAASWSSTWSFTTWNPPTTDWYTSKNVIRGQVFDRTVAAGGYLVPLSGIPVTITYIDHVRGIPVDRSTSTSTNSLGYFSWKPPTDVSVGVVWAGWGDSDGYWTERRGVSCPTVGQLYGLLPDHEGYVYPFQSYNHLVGMKEGSCVLSYEFAETTRVSTSILPGEAIGYTWYRDYSSGAVHGSNAGWSSMVARDRYLFTGVTVSTDPVNAPFAVPTVKDYWPVGNQIGSREWNDFLVDPYTTLESVPADAVLIPTDIVGAGGYDEIWDSTQKLDGWTNGFHIPIPIMPGLFYNVQLYTHEKITGGETTLRAHIDNTDTVSHQYLVWVQGPILHVWLWW